MQRHCALPHRTQRTQTAPSPFLGDGLAVSLRSTQAPSTAKTSLRIGNLGRNADLVGLDTRHVHLARLPDRHVRARGLTPGLQSLEVPDHHTIRAVEERQDLLVEAVEQLHDPQALDPDVPGTARFPSTMTPKPSVPKNSD